jgi:hypothetical protein
MALWYIGSGAGADHSFRVSEMLPALCSSCGQGIQHNPTGLPVLISDEFLHFDGIAVKVTTHWSWTVTRKERR